MLVCQTVSITILAVIFLPSARFRICKEVQEKDMSVLDLMTKRGIKRRVAQTLVRQSKSQNLISVTQERKERDNAKRNQTQKEEKNDAGQQCENHGVIQCSETKLLRQDQRQNTEYLNNNAQDVSSAANTNDVLDKERPPTADDDDRVAAPPNKKSKLFRVTISRNKFSASNGVTVLLNGTTSAGRSQHGSPPSENVSLPKATSALPPNISDTQTRKTVNEGPKVETSITAYLTLPSHIHHESPISPKALREHFISQVDSSNTKLGRQTFTSLAFMPHLHRILARYNRICFLTRVKAFYLPRISSFKIRFACRRVDCDVVMNVHVSAKTGNVKLISRNKKVLDERENVYIYHPAAVKHANCAASKIPPNIMKKRPRYSGGIVISRYFSSDEALPPRMYRFWQDPTCPGRKELYEQIASIVKKHNPLCRLVPSGDVKPPRDDAEMKIELRCVHPRCCFQVQCFKSSPNGNIGFECWNGYKTTGNTINVSHWKLLKSKEDVIESETEKVEILDEERDQTDGTLGSEEKLSEPDTDDYELEMTIDQPKTDSLQKSALDSSRCRRTYGGSRRGYPQR